MKSHQLLSLFAIIALLVSCKKDSSGTTASASLNGTYTFKSLSAKTTSTLTGSDGEKLVTTSNYTSTNNQGTFVFNNSNIAATGLSYEVNAIATGYYYDDNELLDSTSAPYTFTLPLSNSSSNYKLIGTDSIYFPNGFITSVVGASGSTQYGPSGGHYSLSGNVLTLTQAVSKDSSFQDSGVNFQMVESATPSMVFEKQ